MHRVARWAMGLLTAGAFALVVAWTLSSVWPGLDERVTLVATALAILALHRWLVYAEERGWVYYRKARGSHGGLGVTSNFLNMYDPSRRHLQEAVREPEWKRDEDDDGPAPPPPLR